MYAWVYGHLDFTDYIIWPGKMGRSLHLPLSNRLWTENVTSAKRIMFSFAFVCLLLNRIIPKLLSGFPWNLVEGCGMDQERTSSILVWTLITGWIQGFVSLSLALWEIAFFKFGSNWQKLRGLLGHGGSMNAFWFFSYLIFVSLLS